MDTTNAGKRHRNCGVPPGGGRPNVPSALRHRNVRAGSSSSAAILNRSFTVDRRNCGPGVQGRAVRPPPVKGPRFGKGRRGSRALLNSGCGHDFWRSVAHERRPAGGDRIRTRSRAPIRNVGRRVAGHRHRRNPHGTRASSRRRTGFPISTTAPPRTNRTTPAPGAATTRALTTAPRGDRASRTSPRGSTRSPDRSTT